MHSCYEFICKEIFVVRLSKNQYKSTMQSQFLYVKKTQKKLIINITLTEINNETHYVPKKKPNKKNKKPQNNKKQKQDKTAPIGFALSV